MTVMNAIQGKVDTLKADKINLYKKNSLGSWAARECNLFILSSVFILSHDVLAMSFNDEIDISFTLTAIYFIQCNFKVISIKNLKSLSGS